MQSTNSSSGSHNNGIPLSEPDFTLTSKTQTINRASSVAAENTPSPDDNRERNTIDLHLTSSSKEMIFEDSEEDDLNNELSQVFSNKSSNSSSESDEEGSNAKIVTSGGIPAAPEGGLAPLDPPPLRLGEDGLGPLRLEGYPLNPPQPPLDEGNPLNPPQPPLDEGNPLDPPQPPLDEGNPLDPPPLHLGEDGLGPLRLEGYPLNPPPLNDDNVAGNAAAPLAVGAELERVQLPGINIQQKPDITTTILQEIERHKPGAIARREVLDLIAKPESADGGEVVFHLKKGTPHSDETLHLRVNYTVKFRGPIDNGSDDTEYRCSQMINTGIRYPKDPTEFDKIDDAIVNAHIFLQNWIFLPQDALDVLGKKPADRIRSPSTVKVAALMSETTIFFTLPPKAPEGTLKRYVFAAGQTSKKPENYGVFNLAAHIPKKSENEADKDILTKIKELARTTIVKKADVQINQAELEAYNQYKELSPLELRALIDNGNNTPVKMGNRILQRMKLGVENSKRMIDCFKEKNIAEPADDSSFLARKFWKPLKKRFKGSDEIITSNILHKLKTLKKEREDAWKELHPLPYKVVPSANEQQKIKMNAAYNLQKANVLKAESDVIINHLKNQQKELFETLRQMRSVKLSILITTRDNPNTRDKFQLPHGSNLDTNSLMNPLRADDLANPDIFWDAVEETNRHLFNPEEKKILEEMASLKAKIIQNENELKSINESLEESFNIEPNKEIAHTELIALI